MKKFFKKKVIFVSLLVFLAICFFIVGIDKRHNSLIQGIISNKKTFAEGETEPEISYRVVGSSETNLFILVTISDEDKQLKQIETPEGNVIYCDGVNNISLDNTVEGGVEYTYKVTTIDGVVTDKKILILNNFDITVSDITTTGFKMGLSGVSDREMSLVEDIKYYVDTSISGTNYQSSDEVNDLTPRTHRYVWAEILYSNGIIKRSSNYKDVYTAHTHSDEFSCYTYNSSSTLYSLSRQYSLGNKTGYYKTKCSSCGKQNGGVGTPLYEVYFNQGGNVTIDGSTVYTDICCNNCGALGSLTYGSGPVSHASANVWGCNYCGKNYVALSGNATDLAYKCYHRITTKSLVDTIPEEGVAYNQTF